MADPIDVTSEEYRVYSYPSGDAYRIDDPVELYVLRDDQGTSHRVVDKGGVTHRPERGWIAISWKPRPGAPAYVV